MNTPRISKWEDFYKLPLWYDGHGYAWVRHSDDTLSMALTFEDDFDTFGDTTASTHRNEHIVSIINGECMNDTDQKWSVKDGCDLYDDDEYVFCVRGWGELTSPGCLNLNIEDAIKIQDGFVEYLLNVLNN